MILFSAEFVFQSGEPLFHLCEFFGDGVGNVDLVEVEVVLYPDALFFDDPRGDADEETLARVAEVAEAYSDGVSPAVVYGDTDIIDAEGRFLRHRRLAPPEALSWRSFKHGMLVCHQAFYAHTQQARQVPYDTRYRFSADVDWCIRVMKKAEEGKEPLCNAGKVLALYLEEGQTTLHHKESLKERLDVMRRHYGLCTTVAMHVWFVIRRMVRAF